MLKKLLGSYLAKIIILLFSECQRESQVINRFLILNLTQLITEILPRDTSMSLNGINTCLGVSKQVREVCLQVDRGATQENSSGGKKT